MKRSLQLIVAAAAMAFGASVVAQSVPELNFTANADIVTLPAYGEVAGVATNSSGHIFVLARTGEPRATLGHERTFYHGGSQLFQFDQNGRFVREIGQETYGMTYAQQVRVDRQDNVWVVDAGSNMLTAFDSNGWFVKTMGRKPESIPVRPGPGMPARLLDPEPEPAGGRGRGASGPPGAGTQSESFNRPSDVAFDSTGNIYIADGIGTNNRIAVYNRDGNWVRGWGQTGSNEGQFDEIRGLVIDAVNNVYVADSGNNRIQVFDSQGTFKSQITGIGSPQAICMTGGPTQYLFSSNSNDPEGMENGEIYKVSLSGQVLGKFGRAGKVPGEFGMVNSLDCRTETDLFVGEVWNWRVTKVTLR
jgi:hypothetical protein